MVGQALDDSGTVARQEPCHGSHPLLGLPVGANRRPGPRDLAELHALALPGMLEQLLFQLLQAVEGVCPSGLGRSLERRIYPGNRSNQ